MVWATARNTLGAREICPDVRHGERTTRPPAWQEGRLNAQVTVSRDPDPPETICCYIVQCADGTLYTGWTADIVRRVRDHNAGRGGRYTRARRPVNLIYTEPQPDARSARQREVALKRLRREAKLALAEASHEPSED